jgi:L-cysteine S-thiosulfotransferase
MLSMWLTKFRFTSDLKQLAKVLIVSTRAALTGVLLAPSPSALAQGIPEPLTDTPGDPARGREIVADRQVGLCILCHAAPLPEVPFMGDLGPDLAGVGSRLTVPELRERIVDSRRVNPDTIMPPYHSLANLTRVGSRWRGTTILTEQQVEDVVAYLATLTDGAAE